jgi:hypothetical protein
MKVELGPISSANIDVPGRTAACSGAWPGRVTAAILLAGWLACRPASLAAAEKTLRWKFTAGQQLLVDLRQTTVTEARSRDEPQRMTTEMVLEMLWEVDRVDGDGTAATTQSFRRLAAKTVAPRVPPLVYDSAADTPPAPEVKTLAEALQALLKSRFPITLSRRGEIGGPPRTAEAESQLAHDPRWAGLVRLMTAEGVRQTLSPALGLLPSGPVKSGATWNQLRDVESPQGRLRIVAEYTYAGPMTDDGRALERIRVETTLRVIGGDPSAVLEPLPQQRMQGVLLFDAAAGRLVRSELSQTLTSQGTYRNKKVAMTATTTVTLQITAAPEK